MARLGKLVQKAFYLGMGVASVAADRAGTELAELRQQAQKLADELVERGEMTTQDAREFVDTFVKQQMKQAESAIANATAETSETDSPSSNNPSSESQPRTIQIDDASTQITTAPAPESKSGNTSSPASPNQEALRQEIDALKAELDRLRNS